MALRPTAALPRFLRPETVSSLSSPRIGPSKGEEKNADKDAPAASVNQPFPEEVVQGGDVNRTDHAAIISKTHLHLKIEAIHSPTLVLPQILLALLGKEII